MILHPRIRCSLPLALLLMAVGAQAATTSYASNTDYFKNIEFSAAAGADWYNVPNTNLVISSYETDKNLINKISADAAWKIGVGYYVFEDNLQQRQYLNHLLLEVNVYQTYGTLKGNVWQYELPQFNNYTFNAPLYSTRLMLDFKPSLFTKKQFSPYPILGIGETWNSVSYNETAINGIDPNSALALPSRTTGQLAWDVGAGFSFALSQCAAATAEYIYTFLGHGSPANQANGGIRLTAPPNFSLQTQSLLLGLSLKL